jgi:hypothetical protein
MTAKQLAMFSISASFVFHGAEETPLRAGDGWEARLRAEAPRAWADLESAYSHMECKWSEAESSGAAKQETKKHLLINDQLIRLEITKEDGSSGLLGANRQYLFHLKRRSGQADYTVGHVGTRNSFNLINSFRPQAQASCFCENIPLSRLLQDKHFTTRTVEPFPVENGTWVRWEVHFEPDPDTKIEPESESSWLKPGSLWDVVPENDEPSL